MSAVEATAILTTTTISVTTLAPSTRRAHPSVPTGAVSSGRRPPTSSAVDLHQVLPFWTAVSASDHHRGATTAQVDATVPWAKSKDLEVHTIGDTRNHTSLNRLPVLAALGGRSTTAQAAGASQAEVRPEDLADACDTVGVLSHCPPRP